MGFLDYTQECHDAAEGILPKDDRGKKPIRLQVFENQFIEKWFAQAHPITPGIWFGWIPVVGVYVGVTALTWWSTLLAFAAGLLTITLVEYSLHRWLFHFAAKNKKERLQAFLLHGYHHDFPNDPMRLVLPPIGIWPVAGIIGAVYWFAMSWSGLGAYFWPFFGGSAIAYIGYDWVHYYTHHFNPKGGVGKWIKRYHMAHHFDSPNHRYGITSPLWDFVFGTYLSPKKSWRAMEKKRLAAESAAQA